MDSIVKNDDDDDVHDFFLICAHFMSNACDKNKIGKAEIIFHNSGRFAMLGSNKMKIKCSFGLNP